MLKVLQSATVLLLMLAATSESFAAEKITVFASILPQRHFIERIAQDRVSVQVMVAPGASPATYEPKPQQMVQLSRAAAYFAVGVPFERAWLHKIAAANPSMEIVHTDHGIEKLPMAAHSHGDAHHEAHTEAHTGGIEDPHIWTSPPLVLHQARNIYTALARIDPARRSDYERNYRAFARDLIDLDLALLEMFSGQERLDRFMVFHPSWGYFARAYGLRQVPIEIEGKSPKPGQVRELIEEARAQKVRVIFVQPQFSSKAAEVIAREIGGRVVSADPLAPDWEDNLRKQAEAFRSAMQ